MADWKRDLEDLCEKITEELSEANRKLDKSNGTMTGGDVEYVDKLTHALKSIKTVLAMEGEYSNEGGSYRYNDGRSNARGRNRGGSYDGSYARGRNARRDSMGRYSSERGYSRAEAEDMVEQLRDLMEDAPDEHTRKEFEKFISKIEQM